MIYQYQIKNTKKQEINHFQTKHQPILKGY
jgi:hypothetical protein